MAHKITMISHAQYLEMLQRTDRKGLRLPAKPDAVARELPLHDEIMAHCNKQWPRWKFIRARSDQRSTIAEGANDFTIFMPSGRLLLVEVKSKTGKLSPVQRDWAHEMKLLGHTVYECRSMSEFMALTKTILAV